MIDRAFERFGRVDILVNNAAVFLPCQYVEMTEAVWDDTVDPDLKGAYFLAQFAAEAMITAGRSGRIINLLSTDAFRPTGVLSAYGAAKLGLWSPLRPWQKELAEHGILVNAITPGSIIIEERIAKFNDGRFGASDVPEGAVKTREKLQAAAFAQMLTTMMPLGRPGYPDEIAKAVLFLASDMASYVSGANLIVDGAQIVRQGLWRPGRPRNRSPRRD